MATDNTLQSIELILPSFSSAGGEDLGRETRCFSGAPYLLRYKLTPEDYLLRGRDDIRVYVDVTEGLELIDSCTIKELQAYSSGIDNRVTPEVVFKNDVTGTVKLKMCVEDLESGNTVSSNVLELNVQPKHGTISDEDVFWDRYSSVGPTVNTDPVVLRAGETFDCISRISLKKHSRYPNLHRGISRYFYVVPISYIPREGDWKPEGYTSGTINSASFIGTKTDGTTLVAKSTGCGKVDIHYLVQTSSGSYTTGRETIPFTVIDDAEALGSTMNLRFKVPSVEVDRSTRIFPSTSDISNPSARFPGIERPGEDGYLNKWVYLNETYDFHPTKWSDFVEYDDPDGKIDLSRLQVRLENDEGQPMLFFTYDENRLASGWNAGSCWLVARYGKLTETREQTEVKIPYRNITSDLSYIPIRAVNAGFSTAHADELDFSVWYPGSKVIEVSPSDATINVSQFSMSSRVGDLLFIEKIGTTGTIDDQYRVRIAGIGTANLTSFCSYVDSTVHHYSGAIFTIGLPAWDGYRYRADYVPDSRIFVPSKSEIKKGEYVFVELKNTPDEEYSLNSTGTIYKYIRYRVNSEENPGNAEHLNASGVAEVVCASRRGVILRGGNTAGTVDIYFGGTADGSNNAAVGRITVLNSTYSAPSGTPTINAQKNTNGSVKSDQTLTLSGGTVAGWNIELPSWQYASITKSGFLKTYSTGNITVYAVTTDGRLASTDFATVSSEGTTPIEPEPEIPVDTTLKEAQDITDDIVLEFSNRSDIVFESPESDPISRDINKISHNFDIRDVVCISENPGVATIQAYYNMSNGNMNAVITPVGKGSTVVKILCGAESDSINVSVLEGTTPATPHLTYKGMTGASLNIYEYTEISYGCDSLDVYENLSVTGNKEGIEIQDQGYIVGEQTARFTVALTDHVSGYVYVTYGSERLIFSIANRFNLKFEDVNNFSLGVGASRDIKIYPLDDTVKASEVQVFSENNNVTISSVTNGGVEPETGKRFFLVTVTYRRSGNDMLIAKRKGDDDIYLDFSCEAKSIPAQSISFNQNSIIINK